MAFTSGCNHPSFTLPWRTLLPYLVALHLLQPGSAQLTVVAPSLRVTANVGQDVVLRCHLSPRKDARNLDIRWILQQSSRLVHHYRNGVDLDQMLEYEGRTELLRKGLSDGNLDLLMTAVTSSDSGSYSCAVLDGDGYGDAVVELEVSDLFSQITHPWKVALAVIVTILVGSFVIIVFLYRKKVAQSRELKRKDAELVEQAVLSKQRDAVLEKHVLKLEEKTDEVENWNSVLKKDSEEMGYGFAELKKLAAELEKHSEEMGTRDVKLERLAAKLEIQTKELEKQHSQFQRHFQNMYLSAGKQKKMVTKLEAHCEWMVRRNVKLEIPAVKVERRNAKLEAAAVKVGHKAKESEKQKSELKERHEEMAEQTEAVVVETEESEKPSEESD